VFIIVLKVGFRPPPVVGDPDRVHLLSITGLPEVLTALVIKRYGAHLWVVEVWYVKSQVIWAIDSRAPKTRTINRTDRKIFIETFPLF
jgi:hypothetical protein